MMIDQNQIRFAPTGSSVAYTMPICEARPLHPDARYLWLDPETYPQYQKTPETIFVSADPECFCVADFTRTVSIPEGKNPTAHICIFADTKFRLYVNGTFVGIGPVSAGGDYGNRAAMPYQYYNRYDLPLNPAERELTFLAEVHTRGAVMTDYSCGRGGFILSCEVTYEDRDSVVILSDENWLTRVDPRWKNVNEFDETIPLPAWEKPYCVPSEEAPWNLSFADIPMLAEDVICPRETTCEVKDGVARFHFDFDKIYSAYVCVEVEKNQEDPLEVKLLSGETAVSPIGTWTVASPKANFRTMRMWSVGEVECHVPVMADGSIPAVKATLVYAHYPFDPDNLGDFTCSDEMLSKIYAVGRHTLEICRQTLHLDSPLHQETLGCTGDYAIESMMTHMTYGDMRLSRLDILRTADYLVMTDGYMFHTSYSLIWVQMVMDYYRYTGDMDILVGCEQALRCLFGRFAGYLREDGIIDHPINYMFIDWANVEGRFTMHHPPKSLGQTCLNAFYRPALLDAAEWLELLGKTEDAAAFRAEAARHKEAFNRTFFDPERGIYFDGLTDEYETRDWLPANSERRYYTRHSNALAVLYGFIEGDEAKALMERVVTESSLDGGATEIDVQPYFMHYVMEAVHKVGLFGKHGLRLMHLWDNQIIESPKGMKEGWNLFVGDHSHAWGATPVYQLPARLAGFELTHTAFGGFRLKPDLYGLDWAKISIPTPFGLIHCDLTADGEGTRADIRVPDAFAEVEPGVYRLK